MSVLIDLPTRPVQPTRQRVQPVRTSAEPEHSSGEEEKATTTQQPPHPRRSWQQGRSPRAPSPAEDDDQPDCIDHVRLWLQRWTLLFVRYPLTERVAHFAYIRSLYLQALMCLIVMMVRKQLDANRQPRSLSHPHSSRSHSGV